MVVFSDPHGLPVLENELSSKAEEYSLAKALQTPIFEDACQLHHLWTSLAKNSSTDIPLTSNFKPTLVPAKILPSMFMLSVLDDGMDFRWRLFGTTHVQHYGSDPTGKCVSEAAQKDSAAQGSLLMGQLSYAERRPVFYVTDYIQGSATKKSTGTVLLPMMDGSGTINRIAGCSTWARNRTTNSL